MRPTRRYWELLGVAILVTLGAILFDRPVLLGGAAVLFGWLLAEQVAFASALSRLDDSLTVEQSLPQRTTAIDEPLPFTLSADGDAHGVDVTVSARPSVGLEMDEAKPTPLGEPLVGALRSPLAGTHTLEAPEITVTDSRGLFRERLTRGSAREIAVQPREPKRVHVGEGGESIPIAFGEHVVSTGERGLIPAEIREYVGGESISRIDWKATARLGTPHVREFETESELATVLIVDRRGRLDVGPPGETAFEYLRSGALGYLTAIESLGDPVGCVAVDEERVELLIEPAGGPRGYDSVRQRLQTATVATAARGRDRKESLAQRSPMLETDTTFGETLTAYTDTTVTTASSDPLPAAIKRAVNTQQSTVQLAVFTDDSDHAELRAVVAEAEQANAKLNLFIAPRSLYETGTSREKAAIAERYGEFERFRRQLSAVDGVTAYEVAPRDRIERVLERGLV